MHTSFLISFLSYFIISFSLVSDDRETKENIYEDIIYPQGEFTFPINPGRRASLSGTYGDIRFNHFHAGLDIRTGGVEGVPVHSAADGYVSRIGVSTGGYGNALYITHSNGYTTVYGHLKEFAGKIKSKLVERQYQQKSWEIDIYFEPGEIQVSNGEIVALSGNTGGSGGPHLHFEIRNQAEETINPALFGFSEVVDNVAPIIINVTLKPIGVNSRINGQFGEVTLKPIWLKNGNYLLNNTITATGKIGVIIYAYDKSQTSPFKLGVTEIVLQANDLEVYNFSLEKMSFDTKIDMNIHTDYEKMVNRGVKSHRLYVEKGNRMNLYQANADNGLVEIGEKRVNFEASLKDTYSNETKLNFKVLPESGEDKLVRNEEIAGYAPKLIVNKFDDIIRVQAIGGLQNNHPAIFQYKGIPKKVDVSYRTANSQVYLYDLNDGLVDFVQVGEATSKIGLNTQVSPLQPFASGNNYQLDFQNVLYSNLFINVEEKGDVLKLDEDIYPLKGRFNVNWQTNSSDCEKCGVYLSSSRNKFIPSQKIGSDYAFRPKELGEYRVLSDNTPPSITVRKINSAEISFYIKDNLSGIKNISCFVDDEWIMMEYEPKQHLVWSEKLNPKKPFQGKLLFVVEDNQGNKKVYERNI